MFGLILILIPLGVGAYLLATQLRSNGPTSPAFSNVKTSAQSGVAATNLQAAATVLQGWFAQYNTYAGAVLPVGSGVTLVRADTTSYCLQTATSPVEHEVGPNGQPQSGPCV
jgi:hypothetical protein